jgi:hypothetical protein
MPQRTGTHDIGFLLAAQNQTVVEIGVDTVAEILAQDNANHNALVQEALSDLCAISTDRQRRQGTSVDGDMLEADEYSRIPTQRASAGQLVGFPLRKYQFALGWTRDWERKRTAADFAIAQQAAQGADIRRLRYELLRAVFGPTNYTFTDALVDNADIPVKALLNADSSNIQNGPNGETFDGTSHTHYNANATLTAAAVQATVDDVVEHGFGGDVRIYINRADEAAFRLLTGFVGYIDSRLTTNANANQPESRLDITRMDNREIGIFGAARVFVKPWVPANYLLCFDAGSTAKPLVMRAPTDSAGLTVVADLETFPLRAQYMQREFGFGAWNRANGAVLRFNNASYAAPTLSL